MKLIIECLDQVPRNICRAMFKHKHHKVSNTGDHSILVAIEALKIGKLCGFRRNQLKTVVQAAVWHDVGIVNSYDIYRNWPERNKKHPIRSCNLYKEFVKDFNPKVCDIINTHMWPFGIRNIPKSKEAWVLNIADNIASIKERLELETKYDLCTIADIRSRYTYDQEKHFKCRNRIDNY